MLGAVYALHSDQHIKALLKVHGIIDWPIQKSLLMIVNNIRRRNFFGPSGVCALPMAAGRNEGGHYFRYFSTLLLLIPLFNTP